MNRLQRGLRATFTGMAVNVVLSGTKLAAGIIGHSHALVADAVESFADIFSSLIVWRGLVVAAAPADEDHPYGHGKAEPIASAIVAAMLLGAALWIALKACGEIMEPHRSPAPFTLIVLVVVVVVKEGLFRFVSREGKAVDSSAVTHRCLASSQRRHHVRGRRRRHQRVAHRRQYICGGGRRGGDCGGGGHCVERLAFAAPGTQ
jgi:cation diffusion facilitator family transporter